MPRVTGRSELHARIAADFQRRFQDPATRKLRHNGSPQCTNAMALCAGLVPPADRALLVEDIIADLEKRGWQQTPGDVGHVYSIRALAEACHLEVELPKGVKATAILPSGTRKTLRGGKQAIEEPLPKTAN